MPEQEGGGQGAGGATGPPNIWQISLPYSKRGMADYAQKLLVAPQIFHSQR